ncbi:hypothetical protein FN846DRAFT_947649 [Sphaerosporella brunnea]|uniref:Fungal N-terminal domain-containing protein n=1 Tax=Sphaerosporella brunnea TaxID=1250544 RepID=A0A5J5EZ06_9PEZI|nr:hypothetical protein FN846DRAFT_947649 [Sphaerosporella brunnea]
MDPLSIGASVAGLIGLAAQLSTSVSRFVSAVSDAPTYASQVMDELKGVELVFLQLESSLLYPGQARLDRFAAFPEDPLRTMFKRCDDLFSLLKIELEGVGDSSQMRLWKRVKWAQKEGSIRQHMQRLGECKNNLLLLLTVLLRQSNSLVEENMNRIMETVFQTQSPLLHSRIDGHISHPRLSETGITPELSTSSESNTTNWAPFRERAHEHWEIVLSRSKVYSRAHLNSSTLSIDSPHTCGSSQLSEISLAKISNTSMMCLPVSWGFDVGTEVVADHPSCTAGIIPLSIDKPNAPLSELRRTSRLGSLRDMFAARRLSKDDHLQDNHIQSTSRSREPVGPKGRCSTTEKAPKPTTRAGSTEENSSARVSPEESTGLPRARQHKRAHTVQGAALTRTEVYTCIAPSRSWSAYSRLPKTPVSHSPEVSEKKIFSPSTSTSGTCSPFGQMSDVSSASSFTEYSSSPSPRRESQINVHLKLLILGDLPLGAATAFPQLLEPGPSGYQKLTYNCGQLRLRMDVKDGSGFTTQPALCKQWIREAELFLLLYQTECPESWEVVQDYVTEIKRQWWNPEEAKNDKYPIMIFENHGSQMGVGIPCRSSPRSWAKDNGCQIMAEDSHGLSRNKFAAILLSLAMRKVKVTSKDVYEVFMGEVARILGGEENTESGSSGTRDNVTRDTAALFHSLPEYQIAI